MSRKEPQFKIQPYKGPHFRVVAPTQGAAEKLAGTIEKAIARLQPHFTIRMTISHRKPRASRPKRGE